MICKGCGNHFPHSIVINGRRISLANRRYCLDCKPFTPRPTDVTGDTLCTVCGKEYKYKRGQGFSKTRCSSCIQLARVEERKRQAVDYKGGGCVLCGYTRCHQALCFHHLNPAEKSFNISAAYSYKWDRLRAELDKCVLLCNRCHAEVEAGMTTIPSDNLQLLFRVQEDQ